jgi:phenylacetate-CoA ligase
MSKHAKSSNGSFHPLSAPDFLPLPQLQALQLQRLKAIVQRAYDRVALFRKRMEERGHSCPPRRATQPQCGQECPRSTKM